MHFANVTDDVVRLKFFPFTLKDKAKGWLHALRPRSIGAWTDMHREFIKKILPCSQNKHVEEPYHELCPKGR